MHVTGLQPKPVHGREMADGIALMAVQHELRLRRRAGGEVKKQRIGGARLAIRREDGRCRVARREGVPSGRSAADGDARVVAGKIDEFRRIGDRGDDVPHPPAREAVGEVVARQQRRRRHDDGTELHRRQHAFPERRDIAQHQQQPVAAADAEPAKIVGDAVRPLAERGKGNLRLTAALIDDPQRRPLVTARDPIEMVERPVEAIEHGPAETAIGGGVVRPALQQEVAHFRERRCIVGGHGGSPVAILFFSAR